MQSIALFNPAELPRLLLNFDVNGTLILKDTSKGSDDEHMLISALAEATFAKWDEQHEHMSFKQYVYSVLLPGDKSTPLLKKERQKTVRAFLQWLGQNSHPAENTVLENYHRIKATFTDRNSNKVKFSIFPSFYQMMDKLRQMNVSFLILLRTFGGDLPEVVAEIESHPSGVKFKHWGKFENSQLKIEGQQALEKAEEIFDLFLNSQEHFAINDDWFTWNHDHEKGQSGKPFWFDGSENKGINPGRVKNLSLFFDDNITGEEQDIVRPCEISGKEISSRDLCGQLIFPVNTKDAILDHDYYFNRVLQAIEKAQGAK